MRVTLLKYPTADDWQLCKQVTLVTANKRVVNPPDMDFKKRILAARHSTIRTLEFCFLIEDIPYYVSVHLCRHVHAIPFVQSQRNDRQNEYDRNKAPQDALVNMAYLVNAEELQVIANKRLCSKADSTTRELVNMMCNKVMETNPEFEGLLVPMCEYRGGRCDEFNSCGLSDKYRARVVWNGKDQTVEIEVPESTYANAGRILLRQENSNYGTLYYPDGGEG